MIRTKIHNSQATHNKPCTMTGCEKPILAKGLCGAHYQRAYEWKRPADMPHKRFCSVENCDKPHLARGYCTLHYARWKAYGDVEVTHRYDSHPRKPVYCSFEGCEKRHVALGLCRKHYSRLDRSGNPAISTKMTGTGDTPEQRFWSRVALTANPERCWEWQGTTDAGGYGYSSWNGRRQGTHRIAFAIATGTEAKLHVLHSCDNPPCVNPNHLREGTDADNHADMAERGRHRVGSQNFFAKLTEEEVLWGRARSEEGWSVTKIASELCISRVAISRAIRRLSWKHI